MIKLMREFHNFEYLRRRMELLFFGLSYITLELGQVFKNVYFIILNNDEEKLVYKTSLFEFKYNFLISFQILGIFIIPYCAAFLIFK